MTAFSNDKLAEVQRASLVSNEDVGKMGETYQNLKAAGPSPEVEKMRDHTIYQAKASLLGPSQKELQASQNTGLLNVAKETKAGCRPEQLNLPEDVALDSRLTHEIN